MAGHLDTTHKIRAGREHPLVILRRQQGWSQHDLATRIRAAAQARRASSGVNRSRVCDWEAGRLEPSTLNRQLLAEIFGVPWETAMDMDWPDWLPAGPPVPPLTPNGALTAIKLAVGAHTCPARIGAYFGSELVLLAERVTDATTFPPATPAESGSVNSYPFMSASFRTGIAAVLAEPAGNGELGLIDAYLAAVAQRLQQVLEPGLEQGLAPGETTPGTAPQAAALFSAAAELARAATACAAPRAGRPVAQRYACAAAHAGLQAGRVDLAQQALADLSLIATLSGDTPTALRLLHHVAPTTSPISPRPAQATGGPATGLIVLDPCGSRQPAGVFS